MEYYLSHSFLLNSYYGLKNDEWILGMEHNRLTLEDDAKLIENIMNDLEMRYIVLFLYVIRNDLFKDLSNSSLRESYEKILILDEIYKSNIVNFWDDEFVDVYIDLGLMKNIRSKREFDQKDDDFIIKLGEETITIEEDTISVPDGTLFLIINKKFKDLTRRNFNLALTRLKGVRCEKSSIIHSLIYEIGEHDYTLSDDLYYILDQFGNVYQAIKIEITIEGFYQRFREIEDKISGLIKIFDPVLNTKPLLKKIYNAIVEEKEILNYLKDEKVELPEKFDSSKVNKDNPVIKQWSSQLISLLELRHQMTQLEDKIMELKKHYSGKERRHNYLEFVEKVTYNEDNLLDDIQNSLIEYRKELVKINDQISKITKKEIKLLNLDYERLLIISEDD
ncbi:MAG: hypothetical protein ACFFD7_14065 [Candidatus Thorarchaeota archaeon]